MNSGLYYELMSKKLLIPHSEIKRSQKSSVYKVIQPQVVPFITYAYEWSFSMLKDAALTTLRIQKKALRFNMSLKDATPYNIQFLHGHPILIDTLSFERLEEGSPWVAYKQFCEQFLAPLALTGYSDVRCQQLLRANLGTVPLDLCTSLLPLRAKLNFGILLHIVLHGRSGKGTNRSETQHVKKNLKKGALLELIRSLENTIRSIPAPKQSTYWSDYTDQHSPISYESRSVTEKRRIVSSFLRSQKPKVVWDIGANTGDFSRLASDQGAFTLSMDIDPMAVEKNYLKIKEKQEQFLLPLVMDLMNPSPMLGWANEERESLFSRPHPDTILALALIHHIAIGQNVPLEKIAQLFASLTTSLIIEFIPKDDSQVKQLLAHREDIFKNYSKDHFESVFKKYFLLKETKKIPHSKRILYRMIKK